MRLLSPLSTSICAADTLLAFAVPSSMAKQSTAEFDQRLHVIMRVFSGNNVGHLLWDNAWPLFSALTELMGEVQLQNRIILVNGPHDLKWDLRSSKFYDLFRSISSHDISYLHEFNPFVPLCVEHLVVGLGCRSSVCLSEFQDSKLTPWAYHFRTQVLRAFNLPKFENSMPAPATFVCNVMLLLKARDEIR